MLPALLKAIEPIIFNVAPTIATALGGPLAGGVLSLLCETFGIHTKKPEDLVNKVLENVPDAEKKMQDLEKSHASWIKQMLPHEVEWSGKIVWDHDEDKNKDEEPS